MATTPSAPLTMDHEVQIRNDLATLHDVGRQILKAEAAGINVDKEKALHSRLMTQLQAIVEHYFPPQEG